MVTNMVANMVTNLVTNLDTMRCLPERLVKGRVLPEVDEARRGEEKAVTPDADGQILQSAGKS